MTGQPDFIGVRQSLRAHLIDELNGELQEDRIAFENRPFEPPSLYDATSKLPNLWLRETFFVISEDHPALLMHEARGRTLFEVFCPVGSGTERPEALRKLIVDAFEKKYGLTNIDDLAVGIDKVVREQARQDNMWYAVPVSVYWRVFSEATSNRTT